MDSTTFLTTIVGEGLKDGRQLVIWTAPDRASGFFTDVKVAVAYATRKNKTQNVYFGLGLLGAKPAEGRGKLEDVAAIGCLWVDVDILDPKAHKKKNLPPNFKAARSLLDRVGLQPSIIVHSGHGLQAYWLLSEPWVFDSPEERQKAELLSRRWVATFRAIADAQGYDCDAVHDLTRVFRLPDTMNRKDPAHLVEARVIESEDIRYAPDDFDPLLIAEEFEPGHTGPTGKSLLPPIKIGAVMLAPDAEPPALKMLALLENDVKFKRAWNRKRPDLQDQSASSYDMSLANLAAIAEWTDQEIANLIIAGRKLHGDDLVKAMRRDYIMRTIAEARAGICLQQAISDLAKEAQAPQPPAQAPAADATKQAPPGGPVDVRAGVLMKLSTLIGVPITRWVQHGQENARYSLQLADGRWVRMGNVQDVLSASKFRAKVYEATRRLIAPVKQQKWDDVARVLASAVEVVENEEVSSAYQAGQWVSSYLSDHTPLGGDDWQEAAGNNEPFIREGKLYLHAGELRKHMRILQHETQITHPELCDCLKVTGFVRVTVSLRKDGEAVTRSFWATTNLIQFTSTPHAEPVEAEA